MALRRCGRRCVYVSASLLSASLSASLLSASPAASLCGYSNVLIHSLSPKRAPLHRLISPAPPVPRTSFPFTTLPFPLEHTSRSYVVPTRTLGGPHPPSRHLPTSSRVRALLPPACRVRTPLPWSHHLVGMSPWLAHVPPLLVPRAFPLPLAYNSGPKREGGAGE